MARSNQKSHGQSSPSSHRTVLGQHPGGARHAYANAQNPEDLSNVMQNLSISNGARPPTSNINGAYPIVAYPSAYASPFPSNQQGVGYPTTHQSFTGPSSVQPPPYYGHPHAWNMSPFPGVCAPPRQAMNTSYPSTTRATSIIPDAVSKVQVKRSVSVDEEFDWESEKEKMDEFFEQQAANKLKDLPALSSKPTQFKESTKLLSYQNEAVRWLVDMERNPKENLNSVCILQKNGQKRYFDVNRSTNEAPFPLEGPYPKAKGCILADEMGLGKTVQTLGLILYNPPSRPSDPICNVIVCPNRTIIDSWMNEIEKFCKPGTFRIKMYLPENNKTERSKIVDEINNNQVDIAFSTYSFLEAEYRRGDEKGRRTKKMIPHAEDIHRLVLDEAHHIRNRETGRFKAMMFLAERSKHCLALTGTPFVNGPTDIHSLLAFIGMEPLNDHVYFETAIDKPVRAMKRQGLETLRKNLGPVILRRTKNVLPNIELFAKEVKTCKVPFANDEHKETYETLYKVVRAVLDGLVNGHQDENTVPLDIISKFQFTMAQKLSRCCATGAFADYPQLCCAREILKKIQRDKTIKKLSAVEALDILQQLHLANQGENGDVLNDEAIARTLSMPQPPKIKYLLQLMEREMCPEEKGLIFSQWSSYLKIVEKEISEAGHKVARIGGDVPVEQRVEALRFFNSKSKDSPRFLLCPLKAGEGLNLQAANVVFFLDLWWNRASEMQAEDRSHRLGQNKVVRCHHVMMKSSIEERMMNLQKAKEMVGKGTIKALTTKEEKLAKTKNYLMDLYQLKPRDDVESNQHWE